MAAILKYAVSQSHIRKNVRNFRLAQIVLAWDKQEGLAPADHLFQNGGERNSSKKNDIYPSFNSERMREPQLQYMSLRVRAWSWTWLTTIKSLVFYQKPRLLDVICSCCIYNWTYRKSSNQYCYLNFGLPSFIVSKRGTSKARYCVSYDIIWKKNIFAFVLSAEKFSGCLKSL